MTDALKNAAAAVGETLGNIVEGSQKQVAKAQEAVAEARDEAAHAVSCEAA
jgi:hypothetical protein